MDLYLETDLHKMEKHTIDKRRKDMLTKKDKKIVAGFVSMTIIGFVGTSYLLLNDNSKVADSKSKVEQVDEQSDSAQESDTQVSFKDEAKRKLSEADAQGYLKEAEQLVKTVDFVGIKKILEPIVDNYNLTGEDGQALSNMYTDATLMLSQAEMEDPMERARVVTGVNNPVTMAYGFTQLPLDVFLYTVYDGNSVAVAGKGNVTIRGEETYHPSAIEGQEELNPYFYENPYIKLFLEAMGDFHDMKGIYEIPLRVQGVDVTSYVATHDDNSLILMGYYVDNPSEYGDRFQSIDWHLAQRQRLEEAVYTNWGEKTSTNGQLDVQGGEETDETETN